MRQTLFAIPSEIAGLPMFGIGILLAVWVLFSAGLFLWLMKRYGMTAETRGYLPLLGLVAAGIIFLLPNLVVADEGGLPIRGYGVMMMLGIVSGVGLAAHRAPKYGLDPDKVFSLTFWMFVGGIIGARVWHTIQYRKEYEGFGDLLNVHEGGLVVYGALVAAIIIVPVFVWRNKLPGLALADLLAPSMVLGLAFGRIGCLLTGCCFGGSCDLPWAVTFPQLSAPSKISPPYQRQLESGLAYGIQIGQTADGTPAVLRIADGSTAKEYGIKHGNKIEKLGNFENPTAEQVQSAIALAMYPRLTDEQFGPPLPLSIMIEGREEAHLLQYAPPPRSLPVHPTQIYSAINATLLFCLLIAYVPFRRRDGEVFAILLSIYPVARFLLEMIRTDEYGQFNTGLTISQLTSLGMLAGVAVLWWVIRRQPTGQLWIDRAAVEAQAAA